MNKRNPNYRGVIWKKLYYSSFRLYSRNFFNRFIIHATQLFVPVVCMEMKLTGSRRLVNQIVNLIVGVCWESLTSGAAVVVSSFWSSGPGKIWTKPYTRLLPFSLAAGSDYQLAAGFLLSGRFWKQ